MEFTARPDRPEIAPSSATSTTVSTLVIALLELHAMQIPLGGIESRGDASPWVAVR
jgi:hypothetical protein